MVDEDVTKMTDEELAAKVNPEVEAPESPETPKKEPSEEVPETPAEDEGEEQAAEELSPRAAKRLENLKITEQIARMKSQSASRNESAPPLKDAIDYGQLDAAPELIDQLESDRRAAIDSSFNAGLSRAEELDQSNRWHTLLEVDARPTEEKYGWLNPRNKEEFDPGLAHAMNEEYKFVSGYDERTGVARNPGIRYPDFIEARVELAERMAQSMTAVTTKNIAKQTAQTGLRPDGSSAKRLNLNKNPHDMSTEELYAAIGQTVPKK